VHAAPFDLCSPALKSKYIRAIHTLPLHSGDGKAWVRDTLALLDREAFDFIIPCDERTLLPFNLHRAEFYRHLLAIPPAEVIDIFFDKLATRRLASECEVPTADGRALVREDSVETIVGAFGLPVVIKPRRSYALDRLHARARVEIVDDRNRLEEALTKVTPGEMLLERFFSGTSVGLSVLVWQGEILHVFQHRRVHELNGLGSYRVSMPPFPELERASGRMLRALSYSGIAMFEYRVRFETGAWVLLEVNARPWGSMPLAIAAGVDFPSHWFDLIRNRKRSERKRYRNGLYSRNFSLDISYLAACLRRRDKTLVDTCLVSIAYVAGYGRLCIGRERMDSLTIDDPGPGLSEMAAVASRVGAFFERKIPGHRRRRRRNAAAVATGALSGHGQRQIIVVFICQGNICRSPFAAALFNALTGDARLFASSAGLIPLPGRPPPCEATDAAMEFGVNLDDHRSKAVSSEVVNSADLLVVFDHATDRNLRCSYPSLAKNIIRLGDFLDPPGDITDPIGTDRSGFLTIYGMIERSVRRLLDLFDSISDRDKIGLTR
jgi:protein-tyrosine-phosphatase/predicted ATP-grasp superfamily ATP-dependent carboligase